jgi:hypothetical protein
MKRMLFMVLIANALIILSLSSCKKEDPSFGPVTVPNPVVTTTPVPPPFIIDLVADHWVNYENEVYVSTFNGVISTVNASGSRTVNVYLAENGEKTQINHHPITYMGNELWATSSKTDVSLIYKSSAQTLPFKSLRIRVVVE